MSFMYEESRKNLEEIIKWYKGKEGNRNEATTRLHLINEIIFKCLGWEKEDCLCEDSYENQYSDYILSNPRNILIIEAKKEGEYFELPAEKKHLEYLISTLIRDNNDLKFAVEQVSNYCQKRGVPYGCVCNGHQLVVFIAARNDGIPPLHGKCIVFPSLESMLESFIYFWNFLSKLGIEQKNIQKKLIGDLLPQLPPKLSQNIPNYPGVKNRNPFQTDLQILSDLIIEDISNKRDFEKIFLTECYCKSGVLSQYSLLSKTILQARYSCLFEENKKHPILTPAVDKDGISEEFKVDNVLHRPILIIGDVGVGKTSFIRYLMNVDAIDIFNNAITIYIDLGTKATLSSDLKEFILNDIKEQLKNEYSIDIMKDNFVRAVYYREILGFSESIYKPYKESNPDLYKQKEIEYLEQKILQKEEHLKKSIYHVVKGRKKQVITIIDNTDQRDEKIQEEAFLISQELTAHWDMSVFLSLRPETFNRSIQAGILDAYHPKSFTIFPPRVVDVIAKRMNFALKITNGEMPIISSTITFTTKLDKLNTLIKVVLLTLEKNMHLVKCIENISNGNVRIGLELVKSFLGSGHVNTKRIYDFFTTKGVYSIPTYEFHSSITYGDNEYYNPEVSPMANLFDVSTNDGKEHFIISFLLGLIAELGRKSSDSGFVETEMIYRNLQEFGFIPDQIDLSIINSHRNGLIETSARRIPKRGEIMPRSLRITSKGLYHLEILSNKFEYIDAIIVDVTILDKEIRDKIHDVKEIKDRLERAENFIEYLDNQWNSVEKNTIYGYNWSDVSKNVKSHIGYIKKQIEKEMKI